MTKLGIAQRKVLWAVLEAAQDRKLLTAENISSKTGIELLTAQAIMRELDDLGLIGIVAKTRVRLEFTQEAIDALHG